MQILTFKKLHMYGKESSVSPQHSNPKTWSCILPKKGAIAFIPWSAPISQSLNINHRKPVQLSERARHKELAITGLISTDSNVNDSNALQCWKKWMSSRKNLAPFELRAEFVRRRLTLFPDVLFISTQVIYFKAYWIWSTQHIIVFNYYISLILENVPA